MNHKWFFLAFFMNYFSIFSTGQQEICISVRQSKNKMDMDYGFLNTGKMMDKDMGKNMTNKSGAAISDSEMRDSGVSSSGMSRLHHQLQMLTKKVDRLSSIIKEAYMGSVLNRDESPVKPVKHVEPRIRRPCPVGIEYKHHCIKLLYTVGPRLNFDQAREKCRANSSDLIDITSEEMYKKVYAYVSNKWERYIDRTWDLVNVWLATTFEPQNNPDNLITLKNGTKMTWNHWHPGYPYTGARFADRNKLILSVRKGADSENKGYFNYGAELIEPVPLCSYSMI